MPCYYTGSAQGDAELSESVARLAVTKLTRLLCKACSLLEQHHQRFPKDLDKWWKDHRAVDAMIRKDNQRDKHRAKVKARALSKLTQDEKDLLEFY